MNGTWQAVRSAAALSGLVLATLAGTDGAWADDVGLTIQTTRSHAYKGTAPLAPATIKLLKDAHENSDDPAKIGETLRKLKDGDVLVLTAHANPGIFGLGAKKAAWSDFWKTFGITRPPRLAAVIVGACMVRHIGDEEIQKLQVDEAHALRRYFNAELLYAPKGTINVITAAQNTFELYTSLLSNKKLNEFKLGEQWFQSVSYRWTIQGRWKIVSLANLRRVNDSSRAYEAGVVARMKGKKDGEVEAGIAFPGEPEMRKAFVLGFEHANQGDDGVRKEYDNVRKMIEEGQQLQ